MTVLTPPIGGGPNGGDRSAMGIPTSHHATNGRKAGSPVGVDPPLGVWARAHPSSEGVAPLSYLTLRVAYTCVQPANTVPKKIFIFSIALNTLGSVDAIENRQHLFGSTIVWQFVFCYFNPHREHFIAHLVELLLKTVVLCL